MRASKPKILLLDIEASNLNANFGVMLCGGYKWLGDKKVTIVGIDDFPIFKRDTSNDKGVAIALRDRILEADLVVAHYGGWDRFDLPFINARLLYHGLAPLPPKVPFCDTWKASRKYLKLNSNRLATLAEFLGCGSKTPIKQTEWIRAMGGDRKALKYVKDHCVADVEVLEAAYLKLRPLLQGHPNLNIVKLGEITEAVDVSELACPTCGEHALQRRGTAATQTGRRLRFHCQDCGSWSQSKLYSEKQRGSAGART